MNKSALSRFVSLVRYWWSFRTTTSGKILAACILCVAPPAMTSLDIPIYQLLFALAVFSLCAYTAAFVLRPCIEVRGRFPEKAIAGQPVAARFTIINRSRICARDLGVEGFDLPRSLKRVDDSMAVPGLAPGASADASLTVMPLRRGVYAWPGWRVFTTFPFGLFRTNVRSVPNDAAQAGGSLLVYPRFHPLSAIEVPISARYQPGGIALSSNVGESPEYIGNREYRPGDSTRHLDHRAWARLAAPVVREFQEEYYCRVALVLDTFVPGNRWPGPDGFQNLEAAVSLSAAIADALAHGEYIIDIFAAGPELYVFRAGRHTAHFENVLEILASIDACRANPFRKVTPALADELSNISSVIGVFLDWDQDRANLVRTAVEAGCSVKVAIVHDGATTVSWTAAESSGTIAQYAPQAVRAGSVGAL
jgi:uncharacterized protein (DUF58 family)